MARLVSGVIASERLALRPMGRFLKLLSRVPDNDGPVPDDAMELSRRTVPSASLAAWIAWLCGASFYCYGFFQRVAPASWLAS